MDKVEQRLADMRRNCDDATPGPWIGGVTDGQKLKIADASGEWVVFRLEDAKFIAHSRTYMPALLSAVEEILHETGREGQMTGHRSCGMVNCSTIRAIIERHIGGES